MLTHTLSLTHSHSLTLSLSHTLSLSFFLCLFVCLMHSETTLEAQQLLMADQKFQLRQALFKFYDEVPCNPIMVSARVCLSLSVCGWAYNTHTHIHRFPPGSPPLTPLPSPASFPPPPFFFPLGWDVLYAAGSACVARCWHIRQGQQDWRAKRIHPLQAGKRPRRQRRARVGSEPDAAVQEAVSRRLKRRPVSAGRRRGH